MDMDISSDDEYDDDRLLQSSNFRFKLEFEGGSDPSLRLAFEEIQKEYDPGPFWHDPIYDWDYADIMENLFEDQSPSLNESASENSTKFIDNHMPDSTTKTTVDKPQTTEIINLEEMDASDLIMNLCQGIRKTEDKLKAIVDKRRSIEIVNLEEEMDESGLSMKSLKRPTEGLIPLSSSTEKFPKFWSLSTAVDTGFKWTVEEQPDEFTLTSSSGRDECQFEDLSKLLGSDGNSNSMDTNLIFFTPDQVYTTIIHDPSFGEWNCKLIRFGNFVFVPKIDSGVIPVRFTNLGFTFTASAVRKNKYVTVNMCIPAAELRVVNAFYGNKKISISMKTGPIYAKWVRQQLGLVHGNPMSDNRLYFCPLAGLSHHKWITLSCDVSKHHRVDVQRMKQVFKNVLNYREFSAPAMAKFVAENILSRRELKNYRPPADKSTFIDKTLKL